MPEKILTLQRFDNRSDSVVAANAKVVALSYVVGQHDLGVGKRLQQFPIVNAGGKIDRRLKIFEQRSPVHRSAADDEIVPGLQIVSAIFAGDSSQHLTAIADSLGFGRENIIIANGSNEIIELLCHTFLNRNAEIIAAEHAFVVYKLMATLFGMALGGWMSGKVFDLTGSYYAAFVNGIVWNLMNFLIVLWLFRRLRRGHPA